MTDKIETIASHTSKNEEKSLEVMKELLAAAKPESVYSKPVKVGDTQVITASEVQVGLGFGFGMGSGPELQSSEEGQGTKSDQTEDTGMGGGGGGGGGASGRPIAVISIQDGKVEVQPILDTTKIGLAFFTTLGSIFFMVSNVKKALVKRR
jgi:uncharacterized spore protein YtfJ